MVSSCPTCQLNNPQGARRFQLAQPVQWRVAYPGEDCQMDFSQMPVSQVYKYLLVMIDTVTGWINWRLSHPDWEVWGGSKKENRKIAPWNHSKICPVQVIAKWQWDIIYFFFFFNTLCEKVTQGVSKSLGITYYLHCDWRPQSSGKVETANQFLKSVIRKITQETSLEWKEALSIAFLHTHIAPKE